MKKREPWAVAGILGIAAVLRIALPWSTVFHGNDVNFLEADAWYHVRLVENQVHNFPHHITLDPYAAPDGEYVAVAPLFDTLIAAFVFLTQGQSASTTSIERTAAFAPAIFGVLAVAVVWALTRLTFDRRSAALGGLLAATMPGHFLNRTLLGYVDHHALEALLSMSTLAALSWALGQREWPTARKASVIAGLLLGSYLLTWSGGAYLVAILTLFVVLAPFVAAAPATTAAGRSMALTAAVAFLPFIIFQDPRLFRYETQLASLVALLVASSWAIVVRGKRRLAVATLAVAGVVVAIGATVFRPSLVGQIAIDFARFRVDTIRMDVLEARPLFMYGSEWSWWEPWTFFRGSFYLGIIAVIALAFDVRRTRRLDRLLVLLFTIVSYAATIGQNRFGYYLVPALGIVVGWLCARVLEWNLPPIKRAAATVLVIGVAFVPNYVSASTPTARRGMPDYWADAMRWFRTETPEPFDTDQYYLARYSSSPQRASYSVLDWWDQGYWLVQAGHRVPVSNPTQNGAGASASFFIATDEASAMAVLEAQRAKFVLVDWELPFRESDPGALGGRFQSLLDWAGVPASRFFSLCFVRARPDRPLEPIWIFEEAYYQTMAFRLMVLGGAAATPHDDTWVAKLLDRVDANGHPFCEVASLRRFESAERAKLAAGELGADVRVVGLSPSKPAFPVAAVDRLRLAHEFRSKSQRPGDPPLIRAFEVRDP